MKILLIIFFMYFNFRYLLPNNPNIKQLRNFFKNDRNKIKNYLKIRQRKLNKYYFKKRNKNIANYQSSLNTLPDIKMNWFYNAFKFPNNNYY